jgi:hypothetical protein
MDPVPQNTVNEYSELSLQRQPTGAVGFVSIHKRTVRVMRVAMAVLVFLVTNILLAVLLSFADVDSGTAGGIEIVGGLVAAFAYWQWSDPKRRGEPPMSDPT